MQTITAHQPTDRRQRLNRALKLIIGFAISGVFLYATLSSVPLGRMAAAIGSADPEWLLAALGFIAGSYILKTFRWQRMLRSLGPQVRFIDAAVPLMACVAFNNVLPLRAGDVIRLLAFRRMTRVTPAAQLGTLALERLLDLLVLAGLLFAAVLIWRIDILPEPVFRGLTIGTAAILAGVLLFLAAPGTIRWLVRWAEARLPLLHRVAGPLLRLSDAVATLSSPMLLVRLTWISTIAWIAEGGAFFATAHALGIELSPQAALLVLAVGTLSTAVPSSPGYVGTFHYFTAITVAALSADKTGSAAFAVLIHALLWVSTTACGFLLLAMSRFSDALQPADTPISPADRQSEGVRP